MGKSDERLPNPSLSPVGVDGLGSDEALVGQSYVVILKIQEAEVAPGNNILLGYVQAESAASRGESVESMAGHSP